MFLYYFSPIGTTEKNYYSNYSQVITSPRCEACPRVGGDRGILLFIRPEGPKERIAGVA